MTSHSRGKTARDLAALILASAVFASPYAALAQGNNSADPTDVSIKTLPPLPAPVAPQSFKPSGLTLTSDPLSATNGRGSDGRLRPLELEPASAISSSTWPQGQQVAATGAESSAPPPVPSASPAPETTEPTPIAQSPGGDLLTGGIPDPARKLLPTTTGSVQVRKAFKLFAREELIRNLSFRDTPIKEVIAEIARRGNLNILIDKSAAGRITGELRDVTLNEAMDNVLAAGGLQSRVLDNNTVVVGTNQAMVQLGLNRSKAKVFKLSYAHPYDVANLLYTSVFNRGIVPDFSQTLRRRSSGTEKGDSNTGSTETLDSELKSIGEGGTRKTLRTQDNKASTSGNSDEDVRVDENNMISRPDTQRTLRGTSRSQTQEGVGFNNSATDPGSQQIRQYQETPADFVVEQNGGGAIVIPDVKNRQVIVVGTVEDLAVAEESIRLLDRRPKQVHIQVSLIELTNQGVRQLGASLQTQGGGASGFVLGQQPAATIVPIPGQAAGQIGPVQPNVSQTIAGVATAATAQTLFNLLALDRDAGGRINMATFPSAINVTVNTLLQTNKAKVVANPTVVVIDNTEAMVTLAQEVIHKITTTSNLGVTTTNVELTKAGIFLNVLPKVAQDGFITMRLRPQVSSPLGAPIQFGQGANFVVVTLLNIREIMAQEVRIKDGQTLVLGGLFTELEAAQMSKIPYAAETPLLGAFFRNTLKGRNRTELMILITPKIVEEEPPQVSGGQPPTM